jgi:hypothetical protein
MFMSICLVVGFVCGSLDYGVDILEKPFVSMACALLAYFQIIAPLWVMYILGII